MLQAKLAGTSDMTAQQAANIALAFSRLPVECHPVLPSALTRQAMEQHIHQQLVQCNGQCLSNIMRFFASRVSSTTDSVPLARLAESSFVWALQLGWLLVWHAVLAWCTDPLKVQ